MAKKYRLIFWAALVLAIPAALIVFSSIWPNDEPSSASVVQQIVTYFTDRNSSLGQDLATEMVEKLDKEDGIYLLDAFKNASDEDRYLLVNLLKKYTYLKDYIPQLVEFLRTGDSELKRATLVLFGNARNVDAIFIANIFTSFLFGDNVDDVIIAIDAIAISDKKEYNKYLIDLAEKTSSDRVKLRIIPAFDIMDAKEDACKLLFLAHDPSLKVRLTAISFLVKFECKDVIPVLREMLTSDIAAERVQAASSLGILQDEESLPKIRKLLDDEDFMVRAAASEAIRLLTGEINPVENTLPTKVSQARGNALWIMRMLFLIGL